MKTKSISHYLIAFLLATLILAGCSTASSAPKEKEVDQTPKSEQSDQKTFGIIGAMSEEVEILHEKMEVEETETVAGMEFFKGTLDGEQIVLVQSGVGKVNAAVCATILADRFDVDYLINSGVAGGLNADLTIGDIVISTDAMQHDVDITALGEEPGVISRMDTSVFTADEKLIQLAQSAAEGLPEDVHVFQGRIVSGDQFIADEERKAQIAKDFSPFAVEMEGAAIAHVAHLNDIPFVIIRAISDDASGEADVKYEDFVKVAAKNASEMIEQMVKEAKESL